MEAPMERRGMKSLRTRTQRLQGKRRPWILRRRIQIADQLILKRPLRYYTGSCRFGPVLLLSWLEK